MNAKNDNQVIALKTNFKSIINSLVRLVMVVRMVVVGVRIILMMMMGWRMVMVMRPGYLSTAGHSFSRSGCCAGRSCSAVKVMRTHASPLAGIIQTVQVAVMVASVARRLARFMLSLMLLNMLIVKLLLLLLLLLLMMATRQRSNVTVMTVFGLSTASLNNAIY